MSSSHIDMIESSCNSMYLTRGMDSANLSINFTNARPVRSSPPHLNILKTYNTVVLSMGSMNLHLLSFQTPNLKRLI